jgi:hypothetical protein
MAPSPGHSNQTKRSPDNKYGNKRFPNISGTEITCLAAKKATTFVGAAKA